jgi:Ca2+-dependent lipid-binding protein
MNIHDVFSFVCSNAEASGYRAAIDSIGSVSESVAWLNALLNKIWRVRYDLASEEGAQLDNLLKELYPKFVR